MLRVSGGDHRRVPICLIALRFVFLRRDPIVLGVEVVDGVLRKGTPICVPAQNFVSLGKVASMEKEKRELFQARKGDQVGAVRGQAASRFCT